MEEDFDPVMQAKFNEKFSDFVAKKRFICLPNEATYDSILAALIKSKNGSKLERHEWNYVQPIRAICLVLLWKKRTASIASELTTEFSANNTLATKSSQVHHNSSPRKTSRTRKFRYALQWELIHSVAVKDISIAVACKDVKLENATAGLLDASATVDAIIAPVAKINNLLFILFFM
ncbi:hypothetical protein DdX_12652 [Ditylenchus destructor]|uniref:Uncharacterized protein n=1 Tax=Ditylenchus destructor TaxID=166010 RepID=A0AAD4MV82_9BILA|nr:hypothetical protein DdX_12652 [Ditylenchus destructor]